MKKIVSKYDEDNVKISEHYLQYLDKGTRELSIDTIKNFLFEKNFYFVERQTNKFVRYKVIFELSRKYDIVIVVEEEQKGLKVITAYKTNKKIKEKWEKMFRSIMRK